MGKTVSKQVFKERVVRVMVFGIHDAGKTSLIYEVKPGEVDAIIPSTGLDKAQFEIEDSKVMAWDFGVRGHWRTEIRMNLGLTEAVVYVIDNINEDHTDEAKVYINDIIKCKYTTVPILVMVNNQDDLHASSKKAITKELGLTKITDRKWNIFFCSAANRDGLQEGSDWLVRVLTGEKIKKDITESLMTSVKDVTQATAQIKEKTHHYGLGKIKSSLQWILSGCKG